MSQLADLLETRAEGLLSSWLQRQREIIAQGCQFESQLIAHAPELLQNMQAALRQSRLQDTSAITKTHGPKRYLIGFSLHALIRETALLSECIVDLAEETGTTVTLPELRVLNNFIVNVIAEGVSEQGQCAFDLRNRQSEFVRQVLGIVGHDLRNPLGVIQMGATLLSRREDLDELAQRMVARIQSSARRAARLVSDLLDFTQARLGEGIRITPMPADLHAVTQVMAEEAAVAYPTRKVEVTSSGNGNGYWDADRIGQVVQNLVTNALKYSPDGTAVKVVTSGEDDSVMLSVHNQGKPIPADWIARIFQPVQRTTNEAGLSVGLSLYIVQCIVDAHRGRIDVTSTAVAGTTFTVWLPRTAGVRDP